MMQKNGWRNLISVYLKLLFISLCFIVVVAACSIVYGFIAHGFFTLRYVFEANFLIGAIIILAAIVLMFLPSTLLTKTGQMLDRFMLMQRSFDNRENRQRKARIILWFGFFVVLLSGLIQILLSFIIGRL